MYNQTVLLILIVISREPLKGQAYQGNSLLASAVTNQRSCSMVGPGVGLSSGPIYYTESMGNPCSLVGLIEFPPHEVYRPKIMVTVKFES